VTDWEKLATALAEELTAVGKLRSPEWQAAVRAVPRHELVPVHYTMDPHTGDWHAHHTADDLARVYSNTALFVLPGGLSSTSMPGLMTRMLETIDVQEGHRVLEIGAGTGYNIALAARTSTAWTSKLSSSSWLGNGSPTSATTPPSSPPTVRTVYRSTPPMTGSSPPVRSRPFPGRGCDRSVKRV
jgi:hypothetical protein